MRPIPLVVQVVNYVPDISLQVSIYKLEGFLTVLLLLSFHSLTIKLSLEECTLFRESSDNEPFKGTPPLSRPLLSVNRTPGRDCPLRSIGLHPKWQVPYKNDKEQKHKS